MSATTEQARQPDSEALRLLRDFVAWAEEWLREKDRRENYRIEPGTIPPASFAERPAELNGLLRHLMESGVTALAALPPSAPPALDVERLAEALHDSTWACPSGQVVVNWCDPRLGELFHVSQAASIADGYARLASQPGETT